MLYDFMRIIVFFDLPVKTKKQRKIYTTFRKHLIRTGHQMLQYSVYSKIVNTREAARNHAKNIIDNAPQEGNIRLMTLTEKQYANMKIVVGGKSLQEETLSIDPFLKF
jgi:CRISPR-associated protein Cas2